MGELIFSGRSGYESKYVPTRPGKMLSRVATARQSGFTMVAKQGLTPV
jgi:hypothetical protein